MLFHLSKFILLNNKKINLTSITIMLKNVSKLSSKNFLYTFLSLIVFLISLAIFWFLNLPCRAALMLGENSEDEGALYGDYMLKATSNLLPTITIPGTYHHLMFDQPLAVAMSMKILLLEWRRLNSLSP